MPDQAVLAVLLYSSVAAATAVFGMVPFVRPSGVPSRGIGWAYALAAGLMLGISYLLITEGIGRSVWPAIVGATAGVALTYWLHAYTGTAELETQEGTEIGADYMVKFVLLNAVHSASEGVAIGVAMAVELKLGIFMALSFAIHNIAEAMVLTDVLLRAGTSLRQCAALSVITNLPMILFAVVAFAVIPAVPGALPWFLGLTAGALMYMVMTELMPSSYERAGRTGIALLVSVAAGGVVFLKDLFM